jgi:G1/S-specific cyclin PLC1
MLYLLDYDLRIDETELVQHFSPFFKKSSLLPSGPTPPAKQHITRGMPYSASCNDVFTATQTRLPPPKKSEIVPIVLSTAGTAPLTHRNLPVTPEQGIKRPIFARAISQSIKRTITGSGASSSGASEAYSELTEDRGSSDGSPSTSDDDDAHLATAAATTAKRIHLSGPRFLIQRSISSSTTSSSGASSFPLTPTSSADSIKGPTRIGGMVKSVSCYEPRSPLAGKGGKNTWA